MCFWNDHKRGKWKHKQKAVEKTHLSTAKIITDGAFSIPQVNVTMMHGQLLQSSFLLQQLVLILDWIHLPTLPQIYNSVFLVFMCRDRSPQVQQREGQCCLQVLRLQATTGTCAFSKPHSTDKTSCPKLPTENWLVQPTSAHAVSVQMIKATVGKEKGPSPDNSIELNPWQSKVKHWVM